MINFDLKNPVDYLDDLMIRVALDQSGRQRLMNAYAQQTRGYHSLFHIAFLWHCHTTLDPNGHTLLEMSKIADAIACHDVVYDATSKTNEFDSACWWRQEIKSVGKHYGYPDQEHIDWVATAIEASADHFADRPMETEDEMLLQWFLGLDLIPLAAPPDLFDRNSQMIRAEYSHLSQDQWDAGRKAFMTKIDGLPVIYRNSELRKLFEEPARANIQRTLATFTS